MILKELKRYLWDNKVEDMDMQTHKYLIISRVLEHSNLTDVKKIISLYPSEDIIKTVESSTEISRRTAYFWKYYYNILGLRDIGLMKILAIADRGLKKDFIDLYLSLNFIHLYKNYLIYSPLNMALKSLICITTLKYYFF